MPNSPTVVIIGAGPAGLTAALELARRSAIKPIVLEALDDVGGISRTIEYKGNRMDIGGHRFFSKSDWVMAWWKNIMPPASAQEAGSEDKLLGFLPVRDKVMLVRSRLSRIYFMRKFFDYPVSLSKQTLLNLGAVRLVRIGFSYVWARLFPRRTERNLEDFFINRFGSTLYRTFFKDYTEKVWGVPCKEISSSWGAQRIKGLSITAALLHAAKKIFSRQTGGIAQKGTETSLIEQFLYPKFGPGQMWRTAAEELIARGGEIRFQHVVEGIQLENDRIVSVQATDQKTGQTTNIPCDYVVSTMALKDLVASLVPPPPPPVKEVAEGLMYRDFITVGLLVRKLKPSKYTLPDSPTHLVPDTWIYIQEPDVKIGRLQVFNNWSPALVQDENTVWLGLEYFCFENDGLWSLSNQAIGELAKAELSHIDLIDPEDVLDFHVVRVPKAYPAYFGTYDRFDELRQFTDSIVNLFPVGRNGMHRYNNQDHSMLTAKLAVDVILGERKNKAEIWAVNVEEEYHEEKKG